MHGRPKYNCRAVALSRRLSPLSCPGTTDLSSTKGDITFHNLLVSATHNRILARMLAAIRDLPHVSREVTNQLPNALPGALRSHQRIHNEVRAGDPDRAHRALLDHLDRTGPVYLSLGREEAQAPEEDTATPSILDLR